jgi:hypothetical protein
VIPFWWISSGVAELFVGGLLITKGVIDDAQLIELTGAIVSLVGVIWSVWVKK